MLHLTTISFFGFLKLLCVTCHGGVELAIFPFLSSSSFFLIVLLSGFFPPPRCPSMDGRIPSLGLALTKETGKMCSSQLSLVPPPFSVTQPPHPFLFFLNPFFPLLPALLHSPVFANSSTLSVSFLFLFGNGCPFSPPFPTIFLRCVCWFSRLIAALQPRFVRTNFQMESVLVIWF